MSLEPFLVGEPYFELEVELKKDHGSFVWIVVSNGLGIFFEKTVVQFFFKREIGLLKQLLA